MVCLVDSNKKSLLGKPHQCSPPWCKFPTCFPLYIVQHKPLLYALQLSVQNALRLSPVGEYSCISLNCILLTDTHPSLVLYPQIRREIIIKMNSQWSPVQMGTCSEMFHQGAYECGFSWAWNSYHQHKTSTDVWAFHSSKFRYHNILWADGIVTMIIIQQYSHASLLFDMGTSPRTVSYVGVQTADLTKYEIMTTFDIRHILSCVYTCDWYPRTGPDMAANGRVEIVLSSYSEHESDAGDTSDRSRKSTRSGSRTSGRRSGSENR